MKLAAGFFYIEQTRDCQNPWTAKVEYEFADGSQRWVVSVYHESLQDCCESYEYTGAIYLASDFCELMTGVLEKCGLGVRWESDWKDIARAFVLYAPNCVYFD